MATRRQSLAPRVDASVAPHPTAMIERPGRVLRWFCQRFFRSIAFPPEVAARIRELAERGTVVYVCRTLSHIDYLFFTFAFLEHGLPLSRFANGVRTLLLQPLGQILRGALRWWRAGAEEERAALAQVVRRGDSALLFLRRPNTLFGSAPAGFHGDHVEQLLRIQREQDPGRGPIVFVPLVLLWGSPAVRAARTRLGLIDRVFGEREAPGRLRALYTFLTHFRHSQVLCGTPLDLQAFLTEEGGEVPDEVLARKLRWQLAGRLESEIRVVLGPARKGARRLSREVLRSRRLVAEAQEIGRAEGISAEAIERRARRALREIAADPKPWMFELSRPLLTRLWRRIFDGIEVDHAGLERIRAAAREGPLVLVPTHKSHIDYLVLSHVFLENDLVPPHVAAGANLSFWPLGFFFRRGGAFFLRRSFRGDRLYAAVFRSYVKKLLREGHSIEFFIEGGRSRTGKLLAPKLGLLGMVVEAALEPEGARARRAQVVPISIGYEKVIEEKSYAHELAGGEKKAEDMRGLLRATRVLGGHYGRLNIQFDEPISLGATLREDGALAAWQEGDDLVVPADQEGRRAATLRLAHRIVRGINRVTAVTPTALAAAALLATGRRGILRRVLHEQAAFLLAWARRSGGRPSAALVDPRSGTLRADALDRAIDLLARGGDVQVRGGAGGSHPGLDGDARFDEIYTIPEERRSRLSFYRNNAIHLFVAHGLAGLAFQGAADRRISTEALRSRTLRLSRLLKLEFSYRVGETFDVIFEETLAGLLESGILGAEGGTIVAGPQIERVGLLAGQVHDFVESYWIAARALELLTVPLGPKDLERRMLELGEKLFLIGEVRRAEACARANYQNAIEYFKDTGVLEERERKLALAPGIDPKRVAAEVASLLPAPD